ncbi:MAG TPA: methyltransferase domain-containing protein [Syntrophomonadaceae bacterium]|nr:methyltransferase domain-containing protein [Syntrophomonadaceae bacterium]
MSSVEIQENTDIFKCPICDSKMMLNNMKSLLCSEGHCFDLSRSGYVNFLPHPVKTEYDKYMFKSRNIISRKGFFDLMVEEICAIILQQNYSSTDKMRIVDVGCGEGSHLNQIINILHNKRFPDSVGVGIDISKDGIQIAAKEYPKNIWCVADLSRNPFMGKKFEVILNILSPSNYSEFNRMISESGILLKVVPASNHLQELRELFYDKTDKQTYSNEEVLKHFNRNFKLINEKRLLYTVDFNNEDLRHLINMTPLSWKVPDETIHKALTSRIDKITFDLTILCGKKLV